MCPQTGGILWSALNPKPSVYCAQVQQPRDVAGGKGPTLLVVRDKKGHVFGGYASESWTKNGKFFGEVISSIPSC